MFTRFSIFLTIICFWSLPAAARDTLRLDFFHSGTAAAEHFALDQWVREPLPWAGNPRNDRDVLARGKYRFAVHDQVSGELLFSAGFSSIYGEWETTAEAQQLSRGFHESLRFPAPDKAFSLSISKRDSSNSFAILWQTEFDPGTDNLFRENTHYSQDVRTLWQSGHSTSKVDLLILGDGFQAKELEHFHRRARDLAEALFAQPPFQQRRQDFNVRALAPPALESGISKPLKQEFRVSPLGFRYGAFGLPRYMLGFDNKALRRVAGSAPYDALIVLSNSKEYGGGGIYGLYSTAAADALEAEFLVIHEFAHHFAGLADEYFSSNVAYLPSAVREPYEPNVTALLPGSKLKWANKANSQTPLPTPWPQEQYLKLANQWQSARAQGRQQNRSDDWMYAQRRQHLQRVQALFNSAEHRDAIGAFQGANYSAKAYYRPAMNCVMLHADADFCAVCSDAIDAVIDLETQTH